MLTKNHACSCVKMFMGYFGNNLHICSTVKKSNYYLKENTSCIVIDCTQDVETLQWLVRQLIFVEKETKSWLSHNTSIILNEEKGNA